MFNNFSLLTRRSKYQTHGNCRRAFHKLFDDCHDFELLIRMARNENTAIDAIPSHFSPRCSNYPIHGNRRGVCYKLLDDSHKFEILSSVLRSEDSKSVSFKLTNVISFRCLIFVLLFIFLAGFLFFLLQNFSRLLFLSA